MLYSFFKSIKQSLTVEPLPQQIIVEKIKTPTGKTIEKKYLKKKLIGSGASGQCFITENIQTKKLFATKIMEKRDKNRSKMLSQLLIHQVLHHQNIVQFSHAYEDEDQIFVFLELCENGNLQQYAKKCKKIPDRQIKKIIWELIQALNYLHQKNIIHRDIKPKNIFLSSNNTVKLGDFGLASKLQFDQQKKRSVCGTPQYMAPQCVEGRSYGKKADIWSIGIILYELYMGKTPYIDEDNYKIMDNICNLDYKYNIKGIPNNALSLIKRILIKNPQIRPSLQQILTHQFFTKQQPSKYIIIQSPRKQNTFNLNFDSPKAKINYSSNFLSNPCYPQNELVYVRNLEEYNDNLVAYEMSNNQFGILRKDVEVYHEAEKMQHFLIKKQNDVITDKSNLQNEKLEVKLKKMLEKIKKNSSRIKKTTSIGKSVYLVKFTKYKNTFMLKLSNQTVQIKFSDDTSVIIKIDHCKYVIYIEEDDGKAQQIQIVDIINNKCKLQKQKIKNIKQLLKSLHYNMQKPVFKQQYFGPDYSTQMMKMQKPSSKKNIETLYTEEQQEDQINEKPHPDPFKKLKMFIE